MAVPWSNTNANWQDGDGGFNVNPWTISLTPNLPIGVIEYQDLGTYEATQQDAVTAIKTVLAGNRAVWFVFNLPTKGAQDAFQKFWNDGSESDLFDFDQYKGVKMTDTWAHAVLVVGYDTTVSPPCLSILNSWGTTEKRPKGLFRIKLESNFNNYFLSTDGTTKLPTLYCQTLDVSWLKAEDSEACLATYANRTEAGTVVPATFHRVVRNKPYSITDYQVDSGAYSFSKWTVYPATAATVSSTPSVTLSSDAALVADFSWNGVNAAIGTEFSFALEAPPTTKKPSVYITGGKADVESVHAKVLSASYTDTEVKCAWTADADPDVYKLMLQEGKAKPKEVVTYFAVCAPLITSAVSKDGIVTISGSFFGAKAPKVTVAWEDAVSERMKTKNCKIKSHTFAAEDTQKGVSTTVVTLPVIPSDAKNLRVTVKTAIGSATKAVAASN